MGSNILQYLPAPGYFAGAKKPALGFVISFSVKSFQFSVDTFGCALTILS